MRPFSSRALGRSLLFPKTWKREDYIGGQQKSRWFYYYFDPRPSDTENNFKWIPSKYPKRLVFNYETFLSNRFANCTSETIKARPLLWINYFFYLWNGLAYSCLSAVWKLFTQKPAFELPPYRVDVKLEKFQTWNQLKTRPLIPVLNTALCSGACKAWPKLARLRQIEKNVSVTKRPNLCQTLPIREPI
jgi:hypothetical protein